MLFGTISPSTLRPRTSRAKTSRGDPGAFLRRFQKEVLVFVPFCLEGRPKQKLRDTKPRVRGC